MVMVRGLFRDKHGWVEVDYGGTQSPMPAELHCWSLPTTLRRLPTIAPPSPRLINDPEHGRSRAEEARMIAEQMVDRDAIATMLKVAEQYDDLAQKAERRRLAKNSK